MAGPPDTRIIQEALEWIGRIYQLPARPGRSEAVDAMFDTFSPWHPAQPSQGCSSEAWEAFLFDGVTAMHARAQDIYDGYRHVLPEPRREVQNQAHASDAEMRLQQHQPSSALQALSAQGQLAIEVQQYYGDRLSSQSLRVSQPRDNALLSRQSAIPPGHEETITPVETLGSRSIDRVREIAQHTTPASHNLPQIIVPNTPTAFAGGQAKNPAAPPPSRPPPLPRPAIAVAAPGNYQHYLANTCWDHVAGVVNWSDESVACNDPACSNLHFCKSWWRKVKAGADGEEPGCAHGNNDNVVHIDPGTGKRVWHGRPNCRIEFPRQRSRASRKCAPALGKRPCPWGHEDGSGVRTNARVRAWIRPRQQSMWSRMNGETA
ncbi:hypothetical protein LTR37_001240 [Vermiconidia calcicola]|uniref:Uncharacterized protein n=1 Tax=Vermiconidia calcicola TaxID=1690605 RepID=A0ACC3NWD8_9PEZI|nr:hypothetical protein LTR37_001240 [Vermiconidia calcicola]